MKGGMTMMKRAIVAGACVTAATVFAAGSALAQDSSTYYTVMHPKEFTINWKAFYDKGEVKTADIRKELPNHLALAYGDDPKQKLDLYLPKDKVAGASTFIFLHGGGFREGDRAQYGWIARPFAAHGILTIVASYRLTPAFHYPAQPDDARAILAWAYRNIKSYGGDPARLYIGGHSAGAILSAFVSVKRDWLSRMSLPPDLIKGFVPVSGSYDMRSNDRSEYLPDPATRADASPLLSADMPLPPAIVSVGSPERQLAGSRAFADHLRAHGGKVELLVLDGLEHDQTALAIGDEQSPLCRAILRMMGVAARSSSRAAR
jgi:acetyl esterase/lipase